MAGVCFLHLWRRKRPGSELWRTAGMSLWALLAAAGSQWGCRSVATKAELAEALFCPHSGPKAESGQEGLSAHSFVDHGPGPGSACLSVSIIDGRLGCGWLFRSGKHSQQDSKGGKKKKRLQRREGEADLWEEPSLQGQATVEISSPGPFLKPLSLGLTCLGCHTQSLKYQLS